MTTLSVQIQEPLVVSPLSPILIDSSAILYGVHPPRHSIPQLSDLRTMRSISLLSIEMWMHLIKSTIYLTLPRRLPPGITWKMIATTRDQRLWYIRCLKIERCLKHLKLYGRLVRHLPRVKRNSSSLQRNQDGSKLSIELSRSQLWYKELSLKRLPMVWELRMCWSTVRVDQGSLASFHLLPKFFWTHTIELLQVSAHLFTKSGFTMDTTSINTII